MYEKYDMECGKMSQANQERIQKIWVEITQWEKQKESGVSLSTQAQIDSDIASAKAEIARLEAEDQAAEHEVIQLDHVTRVSGVSAQVDIFLDQMDLGGMTLRQAIGGEKEYQLVSIGFKTAYMSQGETFSGKMAEQQALHSEQMRGAQERETQIQRQNEILQAKTNKQSADLEEATRFLSQERLERDNAEKNRDNAAAQLDEANKQIAQQKGHIDDLRNELALGARGAISVIDTAEEEAQKKDLAEQIRKERTIYDVQWVDEIKRNKKKAKLAATGEEIEFPWTVEGKYFVIPESEVPSFRIQYAISITPEVPDVDQKPDEVAAPVAGPQFPTIAAPTLGSGQIQGYPVNVELSEKADEEPVTRSELKIMFEKHKAEILAEVQGEVA